MCGFSRTGNGHDLNFGYVENAGKIVIRLCLSLNLYHGGFRNIEAGI